MEVLEHCPICSNTQFTPFLTCTDYTVSKENFNIVNCTTCNFAFTNPRPTAQEIGKYYQSDEYISHSNTTKGIINSLYQWVRKYTLIKKLQLANRLSKHVSNIKNILDIGCGTGEFLNICNANAYNCVGIEPDPSARKSAIENFKLNVYDQEKLNTLEHNNFDVISMWHVLEHVHHLKERMQTLKQLLKPKGKIIIAVPNKSSYDATTYSKYWGAYDVPRHLYHFTPKDIETLCLKNNLRVSEILPMKFDSFYVSLLSEKYKNGNTNFIKGFVNGFVSNIKAATQNNNSYSSQIYIIEHL
jgi:2-polyprenyl-3-methyl-5-hydroxy-6-metoxy-1,4-benzoquinol methylase